MVRYSDEGQIKDGTFSDRRMPYHSCLAFSLRRWNHRTGALEVVPIASPCFDKLLKSRLIVSMKLLQRSVRKEMERATALAARGENRTDWVQDRAQVSQRGDGNER